jgi:hypothetical protein
MTLISNSSKVSFENRKLVVRQFTKTPFVNICIDDIQKYNTYYPSWLTRNPTVCGDGLTLNLLEIEYEDHKRNNKTSILRIACSKIDVFIKQIESMRDDKTIIGYKPLNTKVRNRIMTLSSVIIALLCLLPEPSNELSLINGFCVVLAFATLILIKTILNKKLYNDYYINLDKYAIR